MWHRLTHPADQSIETVLAEAFSSGKRKVLACHVRRGVGYLAVQELRPDGAPCATTALVVLFEEADETTLDYICTPEAEGPSFFDCLDELIQLLDVHPPSRLARLWRCECALRKRSLRSTELDQAGMR